MVKVVKTEKYLIKFNLETGYQETQGINGYPDPFILKFPNLIDIGIMGNCENKCEFCYQGDKFESHISLENFKKIIDECKKSTMEVALGGRGNPNKHPNFEEMLKYCRENLIMPNYTTSGINLTDREAEITKEYTGAAAVSMHNKDYTFEALNRFINKGVLTNIHFILSNKSIDEAIKLLKGENPWKGKINLMKIFAVVFLLFKPQGRGKTLKDWTIPDEKLKELCALINELKETDFGIGMDTCLGNKLLKLTTVNKKFEDYTDTCEAARMSCYIGPDMRMFPCSFGQHIIGEDLNVKSIKEVWLNGSEFKRFREVLTKERACCPYEEQEWRE